MSNQIDIKSLGVFGNRNALEKIKKYHDLEKNDVKKDKEIVENLTKETVKKAAGAHIATTDNLKGAGAPIRRFDRVYSAKAPIKISTLLNETSKNIVDKYETGQTRDELLRKALDEYIEQNMSLEDKIELHNAVIRDLELFREKEPTVPELDKEKKVIRTVEEIEKQTSLELKSRWGIKQ